MSPFKQIEDLEKRLWGAADQLRANTGLTPQQYSRPVLSLIFLRYAEIPLYAGGGEGKSIPAT